MSTTTEIKLIDSAGAEALVTGIKNKLIDSTGKIRTSLLPSYVDDVIELAVLPTVPNWTVKKYTSSQDAFDDKLNTEGLTSTGSITTMYYDSVNKIFFVEGVENADDTSEDYHISWVALGVYPASTDTNIFSNSGTVQGETTRGPKNNQYYIIDDTLYLYTDAEGFIEKGAKGVIYVNTSDKKIYRWSGSQFIEISAGDKVTFGTTAGTAYEGNKGDALATEVETIKNENDELDSRLTVVEKGLSFSFSGTSVIEAGKASSVTLTAKMVASKGGTFTAEHLKISDSSIAGANTTAAIADKKDIAAVASGTTYVAIATGSVSNLTLDDNKSKTYYAYGKFLGYEPTASCSVTARYKTIYGCITIDPDAHDIGDDAERVAEAIITGSYTYNGESFSATDYTVGVGNKLVTKIAGLSVSISNTKTKPVYFFILRPTNVTKFSGAKDTASGNAPFNFIELEDTAEVNGVTYTVYRSSAESGLKVGYKTTVTFN